MGAFAPANREGDIMGRLILNPIRECKPSADYNFFIVRSAKSVPKGFHHIPELSPPKSLFFQAQRWKKEGSMSDHFEDYRLAFAKHMQEGELAEYLDHLEDLLKQDVTVQIVCFCPDPTRCHRTIIGDYFFDKGYDVEFG